MLKQLCLVAASLLILTSCGSGLPTFPVQTFFIMDTVAMTCREYLKTSITAKPTLQNEYPINHCNGYVAVTPTAYLQINDWANNAEQDYTCKLKQ